MDILSKLIHPFIVNLNYAFHDQNNAYMVMEYLKGGDLRYHLNRERLTFTEKQAQFIIACLVLALEFLHSNGVLFRDLRPENIMFDEEGYCRLIDFGLARTWRKENYSDTSGAPGYIAPEVLMREEQGTGVDYFAVGIIAHELMLKKRPWNDNGGDRDVYREEVLKAQVTLKKSDTPETWGHEASDFINKCIKRKIQQRLGLNGAGELKNHIWFREFDWRALLHRKIKSPFIPGSGDNFNKKVLQENLAKHKFQLKSKTYTVFDGARQHDGFQDQFSTFLFDRDKQLALLRADDPVNSKGKDALRDGDAARQN